jgi:hypothetical protein
VDSPLVVSTKRDGLVNFHSGFRSGRFGLNRPFKIEQLVQPSRNLAPFFIGASWDHEAASLLYRCEQFFE